jgi:aryl-alcohol dehydrogenase-like predicted oxidoreductase
MDRSERPDDAERLRVMHAAVDAGMTSIDTAPLYGFGRSERLVGRLAAERPGELQILTKVGLRFDDGHDGHGDVLFEFRDGDRMRAVRRDCRPASIRHEVEASLGRLGQDCLDVVQIHHRDVHTPVAESMGALLRLREEGKLRAIGVCNFDADDAREAQDALGDVPLACLQVEYSLLQRHPEQELTPLARQRGMGLLCHTPLAQGALAGRDRSSLARDDGRRDQPAFHPSNARPLRQLHERVLSPIAHAHDASVAQLAIAWLLAQSQVSGVLVGASTPEQAAQAAGAAHVSLEPHELQRIRQAFEVLPFDPLAGRPPAARLLGLARRTAGRVRRMLSR